MKRKGLNYKTYEEALANYSPNERWSVFSGSPENFNITCECIDRHVDKDVAIRIKFDDGSKEFYTFMELSKRSSQFANMLKTIDIKRGDRIAIILEACLEFYTSLFGGLKAGATVVVCSPSLGREARSYILTDSETKLVVTNREEAKEPIRTAQVKHSIVREDLPDLIKQEDNKYEAFTNVNDSAMIQYTSGTTGFPKPIFYRHKSLVTLSAVARFAYGIIEGDSFFCPSPLGWGHGMWGGTFAPLIFGVSTGTRSGRFAPELLLEALEEFNVNNISAVPTAYRKILAVKDLARRDVKLEKMTYTGEPMDLNTFHQIKKKFGVHACSLYGSTEVGVIIANFAGFRNWRIKPGSLGKPVPGLEVAVIDENDHKLLPNTLGDIAVKLREQWVRVGDSGTIDEDGYFWYKGRSDDVIKSSGYRVGPEEIESVLNMHEAVSESAVIGTPDKIRGQVVKAFVKLKSDYEPSEDLKDSIQVFAKERLSRYAYPREIEFIHEIPKARDGKMKRKELRTKESITERRQQRTKKTGGF